MADPIPRKDLKLPPMIKGWDLSNGIETHVEGYWKDGVMHITECYEIVDGTVGAKGDRNAE